MEVEITISREVLFEKFNIKHEMKLFLLQQLDGCEIKFLQERPQSIFYIKNGLVLFEQDFKNKYLWIRYHTIWSVFENKYQLLSKQIQQFITDTLDKQFKNELLTPICNCVITTSSLDKQFKNELLTPKCNNWRTNGYFDNQLKNEGLTPVFDYTYVKDKQLKNEGLTPINYGYGEIIPLDKQLKKEGLTPQKHTFATGIFLKKPFKK